MGPRHARDRAHDDQRAVSGTETWLTEPRRLRSTDDRLFEVQRAVLPMRLPLERFYWEIADTQNVLACKHLGSAPSGTSSA
jgi:hypothetical protein